MRSFRNRLLNCDNTLFYCDMVKLSLCSINVYSEVKSWIEWNGQLDINHSVYLIAARSNSSGLFVAPIRRTQSSPSEFFTGRIVMAWLFFSLILYYSYKAWILGYWWHDSKMIHIAKLRNLVATKIYDCILMLHVLGKI